MITLTKDQPMFTDTDWLVVLEGSYQPDQLVEVYRSRDPEQIVAYYAQYIATREYPA